MNQKTSPVANYGGFDRDTWPIKDFKLHKFCAIESKSARTKKERKEREDETGARYTPFMDLPYYNGIRMCIVDPMHNLFLGISKHLLVHYFEKKLKPNDLESVSSIMEKIKQRCPQDVGRVPPKIIEIKDLQKWTADQTKNFVLYFSIPCLEPILPAEDLEIWKEFVQGCQLLCTRILSKRNLVSADMKLLNFCQKLQEREGTNFIVPNMHLCCHLKECIEDYGPIYSFWLFGFERFNGMLGAIPNSNRTIEIELMRKFSRTTYIMNIEVEEEFDYILSGVRERDGVGSVANEIETDEGTINIYFQSLENNALFNGSEKYGNPLPKVLSSKLDSDPYYFLMEKYGQFYNLNSSFAIHDPSILKFSKFKVGDEIFGSESSRSNRSSFILLKKNNNIVPARVHGYFMHTISMNSFPVRHTFAVVEYFKKKDGNALVEDPFDIRIFDAEWKLDDFEPKSSASIIPVQNILCRFIPVSRSVNVFNISPIVRRLAY